MKMITSTPSARGSEEEEEEEDGRDRHKRAKILIVRDSLKRPRGNGISGRGREAPRKKWRRRRRRWRWDTQSPSLSNPPSYASCSNSVSSSSRSISKNNCLTTGSQRATSRSMRSGYRCRSGLQLLLVALVFTSEIHRARASDSDEYDSLLEISDILPEDAKSYDKMRPPSQGSPTTVYFHVTVMSLDSIDESSMTYAADIFFAQSWKDHRLRFPQNMTGEYRLLPVSWLKDIWRPDAFFKNAKSVIFQTMTIPNHYIWLHLDSTILYMVKLTLLLSCAMNFQSYPHDTQQCAMKIESLSHTTDDLVFVWDPLVPLEVDEIELPQLDLVSNDTGDCTQVYSTGNFTCLEVVFTFKRRLGYYLFHTYIPTCLIVIMSWISFWIKPEAVPARVTLGVTSLLTLSTQHANSQKSLPPVSYIKAIDMFMSSCTVFVFLSLMEYAMVNVILGDMVDQKPQPDTFMQKISRKLTIRRQRSSSDRRRSCNESTLQEAENGGFQDPPSSSGDHRQEAHAHHNPFPTRACMPPGPPLHHHPAITEAPPVHMMPKLPGMPMSRTMAAELKEAREKAILVDRFSRIAFPLSFTLLNCLYWAVYFEW